MGCKRLDVIIYNAPLVNFLIQDDYRMPRDVNVLKFISMSPEEIASSFPKENLPEIYNKVFQLFQVGAIQTDSKSSFARFIARIDDNITKVNRLAGLAIESISERFSSLSSKPSQVFDSSSEGWFNIYDVTETSLGNNHTPQQEENGWSSDQIIIMAAGAVAVATLAFTAYYLYSRSSSKAKTPQPEKEKTKSFDFHEALDVEPKITGGKLAYQNLGVIFTEIAQHLDNPEHKDKDLTKDLKEKLGLSSGKGNLKVDISKRPTAEEVREFLTSYAKFGKNLSQSKTREDVRRRTGNAFKMLNTPEIDPDCRKNNGGRSR